MKRSAFGGNGTMCMACAILPLGLVPVPAMADSRGRTRQINKVEARKTRQAVFALFAD